MTTFGQAGVEHDCAGLWQHKKALRCRFRCERLRHTAQTECVPKNVSISMHT